MIITSGVKMIKQTYKMSASLINSWKYYLEHPTKNSLESVKQSVNNVFKTNKWIVRGKKFETSVYNGEYEILKPLLENAEQEAWCSDTIDMGDFFIRFSGRTDLINKDKKLIIDIKRVDQFSVDKYDYSFQHTIYFYLNPDITDFVYLVVSGKDGEEEKINVIHKKRPDKEALDKLVMDHVNGFIAFLKEKDLWEAYKNNQKYKG